MATPTPAAPETPYSAAVRLGCSIEELGYCALCQGYCHRYGRGAGGPLCPSCLKIVEKARRKSSGTSSTA
ncbi:hypothetical protein [Streptomyces sp. NBC_00847]|uniref:hypothetical protein n=1 Tax=Streptomyces sp. NBC_00847 TaxID=2975850 RepID=UPI00225DF8D9|nr:hypothetical protein [Streptomyces sp. NBC_00847]MCX4885973.1 hypothetical protein [Streptomyces sp. NBC_00847]